MKYVVKIDYYNERADRFEIINDIVFDDIFQAFSKYLIEDYNGYFKSNNMLNINGFCKSLYIIGNTFEEQEFIDDYELGEKLANCCTYNEMYEVICRIDKLIKNNFKGGD